MPEECFFKCQVANGLWFQLYPSRLLMLLYIQKLMSDITILQNNPMHEYCLFLLKQGEESQARMAILLCAVHTHSKS